jgi:hypothetical protein
MDTFELAICHHLFGLRRAMVRVAAVMALGRVSHPDDSGFAKPPAFHIDHARRHLEALAAGDNGEDHLAQAAARLMMAIESRDR